MQIIDINIEEVKNAYKKDRLLSVNNEAFSIGLITGAYNEFLLFKDGKQYPVITDWKDISFIIKN